MSLKSLKPPDLIKRLLCLCGCRSYQESSSKVTADGVVGLTRAFLAAGAQCTLVSLWPVPVAASKVFVHAFYTALLNGTKASAALADAMKTVQSSKQYSHPSNWAGSRPFSPMLYFYMTFWILSFCLSKRRNRNLKRKLC